MDLSYQQYFEAIPCYLTVQDRNLRILTANRNFRQDFGSFEGRHCYQVYKHRPEKCEVCPVERTFRDGQRHSSEEQVRCLDGTTVSVIVYTTPIRDASGQIVAVMEMSTDITEIKQLQTQLKESQERYHMLFEEVPCYIAIQDRDLRIADANRLFREDFGDCYGRQCYEVYKHRTEECLPCTARQTFLDGQVRVHEEVVTSRQGKPINVLVHTAPICNAEGQVTSVMEMSANVTQIRQLQSQLASIGLLISSISHGLKGLLNGLDGGIYLVNSGLQKSDDSRLRNGWEIVQRNIGRIRSMVLDILYYAKDREPDWQTLSAANLLSEIQGLLASKARELKVELAVQAASGADEFEGDAKALRTLLVNLLENSMDACRLDLKKDHHEVWLAFRDNGEQVQFEVGDNGIGMDRETCDKAFSLFFSTKGTSGTGLGLFISHKIAQAHGGEIEIQSEEGQGTCFRVRLPRRRPEVPPTPSGPPIT
ncbi:MAG: PAS domain-containing sensor histidine kinase [Candidatus Zixiibacteriota bacterium]|nr:MAG: PAS domain-containing sensor histidine kinase [candidate division Zixibacteria bacterium]